MSCKSGSPKAAVLPVPVCASPIKSVVPDNSTGIAFYCIDVGVSNPNSVTACNNCSFKPKASNAFMKFVLR